MPRTRSVFQGAAVDQLLLSLALALRELPEGLGLDWFSYADLVAFVCPPGRGARADPCLCRPFQHPGHFLPTGSWKSARDSPTSWTLRPRQRIRRLLGGRSGSVK